MISGEEIRKIVIEVVAEVARRPIETLPLDEPLVRGLQFSNEQKGKVLRTIEQRLDTFVLDGIHTRRDFTTQDVIDFYTHISDCQ